MPLDIPSLRLTGDDTVQVNKNRGSIRSAQRDIVLRAVFAWLIAAAEAPGLIQCQRETTTALSIELAEAMKEQGIDIYNQGGHD